MGNTGIITDEKPASFHHRGQLEKGKALSQNKGVRPHSFKDLLDFWTLSRAEDDEDFGIEMIPESMSEV
jgi:hypothetical protein